jgi:hypothetical protein
MLINELEEGDICAFDDSKIFESPILEMKEK